MQRDIGFVQSVKKDSETKVAMVMVAAVALGSSTYAWFVSNNSVKATTSTISAQSNSAYLVIDNKATTTKSTSAVTSEVATKALYPAQWANTFNAAGEIAASATDTTGVYQFESAYASKATESTEKTDTRFVVGTPTVAAQGSYALANTFYVGTGTYDGEFSNLTVKAVETKNANGDAYNAELSGAMRTLIIYDKDKDGTLSAGDTWTCWKANEQISCSNADTSKGAILTGDKEIKKGTDVQILVYVYYDGADKQVFSDNLTDLQTACGVTITFEATPTEFGKN